MVSSRRMAHSSAAPADPTPIPGSDEQPISERRRHIDELIEQHAHARSVDELPPELRDNPMIASVVSMPPEEEARDIALCEAHREAHELYGDDPARILAAFEAGTHPLQRLARAAS
jgi:hypothetical protein